MKIYPIAALYCDEPGCGHHVLVPVDQSGSIVGISVLRPLVELPPPGWSMIEAEKKSDTGVPILDTLHNDLLLQKAKFFCQDHERPKPA